MKGNGFLFVYILLVAAQVILNNFLPYQNIFVLSLLPVMIMLLSVKRSTVFSMLQAFVIGFAVDFFSDGMLGLTIVALLPVAFLRRGIVGLVLGREVFLRDEELSVRRHGLLKISLLIFMGVALYFAIYIPVDCAGTRSAVYVLLKWLFSVLASTLLSFVVVGLLTDSERWR